MYGDCNECSYDECGEGEDGEVFELDFDRNVLGRENNGA